MQSQSRNEPKHNKMWNLNARFRPKELTAVPNFTLEIFTTAANECLTKKLKENKKLIQISPELEITGRIRKIISRSVHTNGQNLQS